MIQSHKLNRMKQSLLNSIKTQEMNVDHFTKKIKYVDLLFNRVIKRFEKYPMP